MNTSHPLKVAYSLVYTTCWVRLAKPQGSRNRCEPAQQATTRSNPTKDWRRRILRRVSPTPLLGALERASRA